MSVLALPVLSGAALPMGVVIGKPLSVMPATSSNREPMFTSDSVDDWRLPSKHAAFNGMNVRRPFCGKWDAYQPAIDDAVTRVGAGLTEEIDRLNSESLEDDLQAAVGRLLNTAALPTPLSEQIQSDACSIGSAVGAMCASSQVLEVKLEIFGQSVCKRWHR